MSKDEEEYTKLLWITITDATYMQVLGSHKQLQKKKGYERKMAITICIQKQWCNCTDIMHDIGTQTAISTI